MSQIKEASDSGLYLLSVTVSVALPDICVSLASPDGRSSGVAYKDWCSKNLGSYFSNVTPDDLYSMRCGVLHNGRIDALKHNVRRLILILPTGIQIFNNTSGDAYIYNVVEFCQNLCICAYDWYEANRADPIVAANTECMMQYREGMPPYVTGAVVIA